MFKKVFLMLGLLALFMLAPVLVGLARGEMFSKNYVIIQVANPYRFDVGAEVKCDWDGKKQTYGYYNKIVVPGKNKILINIGKQYRFCEIWPKVIW